MDVGGISSSDLKVVDRDEAGFNALKAEDFLEMLIVQLQNQDPTEPMGNEELLQQISQIQNIQSNAELVEAIETSTSTQLLSTAANFIGKTVSANVDGGDELTGVVNRAFVADGAVYVDLDGRNVRLSDVTAVHAPAL